MTPQLRAMTPGILALALATSLGPGASAATVYPTPAPSVIAELERHHRPKDWLRVTTDSARFVTRVRVVNQYGLLGLSNKDRSQGALQQVEWSKIARIDVETNHRALFYYSTATILTVIGLANLHSSSSMSSSLATAGGCALAGAIGGQIVHRRPLYVAPLPAP